jgi:integrase
MQLVSISTNLTATVSTYVRSSVSHNTRRAYRSDVADFLKWGGEIPSSPEMTAQYLADRAATLSPYTLARRLVAFSQAHRVLGATNPCVFEIVRATMRGIRRVRGLARRRVDPLLREDLMAVLECIPDTTRGIRDRALLLVGFAGAFRRSELATIQMDDVQFVPEGLLVSLPRSKTDQEGEGRSVAIPWARNRACAVQALRAWIDHAGLSTGAVFRGIRKTGQVSDRAVSAGSVALLIKDYVRRAGFDASRFSGHSLRAGLVTSAAKCGVSGWKIRQQTGHKSDAMVQRYIRDADLFNDNAAGRVL